MIRMAMNRLISKQMVIPSPEALSYTLPFSESPLEECDRATSIGTSLEVIRPGDLAWQIAPGVVE